MTDLTIRHTADPNADISTPDPHQDHFHKTVIGFWVYLMTDCIIFATLFVTYAVLSHNTYGGPTSHDIFHVFTAFTETIILLVSSVTGGFIVLAATKNKVNMVYLWMALTLILGVSFLYIEISEFVKLVDEGASWRESAFLSSFFTLVGTHGIHITIGCLWLIVMFFQVLFQGITMDTFRRLVIFSLFWHFLDLIWIFVFTFVYLMGAV